LLWPVKLEDGTWISRLQFDDQAIDLPPCVRKDDKLIMEMPS
jgi:hypothetical protein